MSKVVRILLVGFAIVILSVMPAVSMTARASMDIPVWRVGDYWVYDFTGEGSPMPGGSGTIRFEVLGTESVTVAGISYPSYHANMTFTFLEGSVTLTIPGDAWFRTSDLAPVKTAFTITISFGGTIYTETVTATYNPPPEMRWPLAANAQWSVSSVVTTVIEISGQPPQTTTGTLSASVRVDPEESRTVPAGTFTTSPVVETMSGTGDYGRSYWSRDAGNSVEERSFASNDTQTGSMQLRSYRYTPTGPGGGNILGLPPVLWAVILVVVLIAVIAAVIMRRRRPMAPAAVPPGTMQAPYGPPTPPQPPPMPPSQPGAPPPG